MIAMEKAFLTKVISILLVMFVTILGCLPNARAGFIPTNKDIENIQRTQDIEILQQVLEKKMVIERLRALGYTEQEIMDRVSRLSDHDLHMLAAQVNSLTNGSKAGIGIAIMMVVLIVLVIYLAIHSLLYPEEDKDSDKEASPSRPPQDGSSY